MFVGFYHFVSSDQHLARCLGCSLALLTLGAAGYLKIIWRIRMQRQTGGLFFLLRASGFLSFLYFFPIFIPFSFLTPQSWSLPPPLSRWFVFYLSQRSCPLLIFSSMFFLSPPLPSPSRPSHTLCPLLFYPNISVLPAALSLSPTNAPIYVTPSLSFPLSCGSWALCGEATPKTSLLLPLLFPRR